MSYQVYDDLDRFSESEFLRMLTDDLEEHCVRDAGEVTAPKALWMYLWRGLHKAEAVPEFAQALALCSDDALMACMIHWLSGQREGEQ